MEPRRPKANELSKIDEFLKDQLRTEINWSFKDEYPLAFDDKNIGNIRIISEQDKILSHAVLKPTLIKTHWNLFKVGLIGSVCTAKDKRGLGLSKVILNSCYEAAVEQECDFVILWTDLFDFYEKLGYTIAGSEVSVQLDQQFKPPLKEHIKILKNHAVSPEALLRVYNQHQLRSLRNVGDMKRYLNIPKTNVYSAWNSATNQLEAYLVEGKGADFTNYVHEWGGKVSSLLTLLNEVIQSKQDPITIILPPACQNLLRQLEEHGGKVNQGILGMIRLADSRSLMKKVKKGARAQGFDQFVFEYRDGKYFFGNGSDIYQTDSDFDIVRLIFGPLQPKQIYDFDQSTLDVFKEIFPIPFWVWGWDSI